MSSLERHPEVSIVPGGSQLFTATAIMPYRVRSVLVDGMGWQYLEVSSLQSMHLEQLVSPVALPMLVRAKLDFVWEPGAALFLRVDNVDDERPALVRFGLGCIRFKRPGNRGAPDLLDFGAELEQARARLQAVPPPPLEQCLVPLGVPKSEEP